MCLGEKRRLLIPEKELRNKYKEVRQTEQAMCFLTLTSPLYQILPDILDTVQTFLEAELTGINRMSWHK